MTTDPATAAPPVQPGHPLPALATFELSRYRRELEHALNVLPAQAPIRAELQDKLSQVTAEQDSRASTTAASVR